MDSETAFFQNGDITVTNARFIVGAQTFAMRNITSVQTVKIPASYNGPGSLIIIGMAMALGGFGVSLFVLCGFGVLLLALGIWLATREKPVFAVVLRTAGGEVTAYQSYDQNYIAQVIEALNQAIISHG